MPFRQAWFFMRKAALIIAIAGSMLLPAAGQDKPKEQVFAGYSFFVPNTNFNGVPLTNAHGYLLSSTTFLSRNIGVEMESGSHYGKNLNVGTIQGGLVGRFFLGEATPFFHGDIGVTRFSPAGISSKYGISLTVGCGWDMPLHKSLNWRLFQADFVYSHLNFSGAGARLNPGSVRLSTGLVLNFGGRGKSNSASVACSANPAEIFAGDPVQVTTEVSGFSRNSAIDYSWSATGGVVSGNGPGATVDTKGLGFGNYQVKVRAVDSKAVSADCAAQFVVKQPVR